MTRMKIGIALGGGAARGWAHIGVIKKLIEVGLKPDIVAGTSIGAAVGGCYIADKLNELEDFARGLTRRKVFGFLDFNLAGSGIISGERLCGALDEHLNQYKIEELDKKFAAVATEIGIGHEVWLSRGRLVEAIRASYALPGIFKPVKIGGRWLMDGALVNPVPISVCRALGANVVIGVNLNGDTCGRGAVIHDHGTDVEVHDTSQSNNNEKGRRAAMHLLHRQFFGKGDGAPGISKVMVDAFNITQDRIARARLAGDPPDIMISPRVNQIGLFDFHKAASVIPEGALAAERVLGDIEQMLGTEAA